jgi:CBS domain containing-hemolysin-like protein
VLLDDDDVETVGGLLAKSLGRVPIPGATAVVPLPEDASASRATVAIRLTAETQAGRRNRIGTVLVEPLGVDEPSASPAAPPAAP